MRTLNRPLSLLLALVMVLSFGVTGVSAATAFTDITDSAHKEAVEIGQAIGLIAGDKDANGNVTFNPEKIVTRAQAAAFITRIMGMSDAEVEAMNLKSSYTDMDNYDWAQPYVAYCERAGIIAGVGGGRYAPGSELTGYQFCRLLLAVLGYEFEAATWQIDTAKYTQQLNLASGVDDYKADASVSRDTVAQLMLNALTKTMVEYTGSATVTTDQGSFSFSNGRPAYTNVDDPDGVSGDFRTGTGVTGDGFLQLVEHSFPNLKRDTKFDDFGNPTEAWKLKGVDLGTYDRKTPEIVYTANLRNNDGRATIKADISGYTNYDAKAVNTRAFLQIDGLYMNNPSSDLVDEGAVATAGEASTGRIYINERQIALLTGAGRNVKLYIDSDNTAIDRIVVADTFIGEVVSVDEGKGELTLRMLETEGSHVPTIGARFTIKTDKGYGQFKRDDKVLVTLTFSGGNTTYIAENNVKVQTVTAPKVVTGKASAKTSNSITVDGTSYPTGYCMVAAGKGSLDEFEPSLTDDATLYLDDYGYVLYAASGAAARKDNAIGVTETYKTLVGGKMVTMVKGVTSNGQTLELNAGTGDKASLEASVGHVLRYTLTNGTYTFVPADATTSDATSGQVIELKPADGPIAKNAATITVGQSGERVYFGSNVKFVYLNSVTGSGNPGRYRSTVIDGVQKVDTIRPGHVFAALNEDTNHKPYISALYIIDEKVPGSTESGGLLFVKGAGNDSKTTAKNSSDQDMPLYGFDAWLNGEKINPFWSENTEASTGGFYRVSTDSDYKDVTVYRLDDVYDTTSGDLAVEVGKGNDNAGVKITGVNTDAMILMLEDGDNVSIRVDSNTKYIDAKGGDGTGITDLYKLENAVVAQGKTVTAYIIYNQTNNLVTYVYITESAD